MSNGKIIATSGNKGNMLVFTLSEYEGTPTFDVRKHYADRKSGEIRPTRKGITLTHKTFEVLRNVIEEKGESIGEWLEMDDEFIDQVKAELKEKVEAGNAIRYKANDYKVDNTNWKSPEFFKVTGEGGKDNLVYNDNHPFFETINSLKDVIRETGSDTEGYQMSVKLLSVIEKILLSFGRTKSLYDDGSAGEMNMVLDSLAINWGIILKNYLDNE